MALLRGPSSEGATQQRLYAASLPPAPLRPTALGPTSPALPSCLSHTPPPCRLPPACDRGASPGRHGLPGPPACKRGRSWRPARQLGRPSRRPAIKLGRLTTTAWPAEPMGLYREVSGGGQGASASSTGGPRAAFRPTVVSLWLQCPSDCSGPDAPRGPWRGSSACWPLVQAQRSAARRHPSGRHPSGPWGGFSGSTAPWQRTLAHRSKRFLGFSPARLAGGPGRLQAWQ